MVNFHDPNVIKEEFEAALKLWYAFAGIFLWEFFTTLDFEWSIIRGHRPYLWTIWIYSLTRIGTLLATILGIIELNINTPINCQLWIIFQLTVSYFALVSASLLLVLRVIAIWKRNKIIIVLATTVWSINVACLILGIVRIRSIWKPGANCLVINSYTAIPNAIATLATDTILLLMMLAGLLHPRLEGRSMHSLGDFLWKQGVIWFALAAIAEVPPAVFLSLNLNAVLNITFEFPALVVLAIAATRMYRSLINFSSDPADGILRVNGRSGVIPLNRMHIAIHTTREETSMPQKSQFNSHVSMDEPVKPWEWSAI